MTLKAPCDCVSLPASSVVVHKKTCSHYLKPIPNADLQELFQKLKELRGSPEEWLRRSAALLKFMAATKDADRILCRGELHLPNRGHFPAIAIYHSIAKEVLAWAPTEEDCMVLSYSLDYFIPDNNHAANAREVLSPETTAVVSSFDSSIPDNYSTPTNLI